MYEKMIFNKLEIGLYLYSIIDKELYIHNLELKKEYRGKGLFKNLLQEIKKTAKNNKCNIIRLQPMKQNLDGYNPSTKKLKSIYSHYGFIPDNKNKFYILKLKNI